MMSTKSSTKLGRAVATAAVAAVVLLQASPASATSENARSESVASGPAYGQHVSECAHGAGFSGTHNPGMHQGAHGSALMRTMSAVV